MSNSAVGRHGELVAADFLTAQGFQIVARNWRCAQGEIDIVAVDGGCVVICEVKTRRTAVCGDPLDAVTPVKLGRLRRLAGAWLSEQPRYYPDVRIDVVAIWSPAAGDEIVQHLRGVG